VTSEEIVDVKKCKIKLSDIGQRSDGWLPVFKPTLLLFFRLRNGLQGEAKKVAPEIFCSFLSNITCNFEAKFYLQS